MSKQHICYSVRNKKNEMLTQPNRLGRGPRARTGGWAARMGTHGATAPKFLSSPLTSYVLRLTSYGAPYVWRNQKSKR